MAQKALAKGAHLKTIINTVVHTITTAGSATFLSCDEMVALLFEADSADMEAAAAAEAEAAAAAEAEAAAAPEAEAAAAAEAEAAYISSGHSKRPRLGQGSLGAPGPDIRKKSKKDESCYT